MPDSSLVTGILSSAGAGTAILVVLFLLGLVWTKHSVDDIKGQRDREIAEKRAAEQQRDEALRMATEQIVPLLTTFVATTQSLIPLLQDLVSSREAQARGRSR